MNAATRTATADQGWLPPGSLLLLLALLSALTACSQAPQRRGSPAIARYPLPKLSAAYNQPYTVKGYRFVPMRSSRGYRATGLASWYGFESGNRTAMGQPFHPDRLSAAHRTLPLPTRVRVTNLENRARLVLFVNDRGPFVPGRIIDLSYGAAKHLGVLERGTARVLVEALP